jgi:hypothetical protein
MPRALELEGLHAYAEKTVTAGDTIRFRVSGTVPYALSACRLGWKVDDPAGDEVLFRFAKSPPRSPVCDTAGSGAENGTGTWVPADRRPRRGPSRNALGISDEWDSRPGGGSAAPIPACSRGTFARTWNASDEWVVLRPESVRRGHRAASMEASHREIVATYVFGARFAIARLALLPPVQTEIVSPASGNAIAPSPLTSPNPLP